MSTQQLREQLLSWLDSRSARPGETVEFSWFVLRVTREADGRNGIETLDFKEMASFTTDLTRLAEIHAMQMEALQKHGVEADMCTNRHAAMVSNAYYPHHPSAFMLRMHSAEDSESGWYIGVAGEPLAINDPRRSSFVSTYELSLQDSRLLPYWLFPAGYTVAFDGEVMKGVSVGPAQPMQSSAEKPWWKLW
jgi:hypothetical protein